MIFDDKFKKRFFEKVQKTRECWNWTASTKNGYGNIGISVNKKKTILYTHRVSYQIFKGKIGEGLVVMHSCDNKLCVNPKHLLLGTQGENLKDMVAKGRSAKGEFHSQSKYTKKQILSIRELYKKGNHTQEKLAEIFGTTAKYISSIINYKRWKHI